MRGEGGGGEERRDGWWIQHISSPEQARLSLPGPTLSSRPTDLRQSCRGVHHSLSTEAGCCSCRRLASASSGLPGASAASVPVAPTGRGGGWCGGGSDAPRSTMAGAWAAGGAGGMGSRKPGSNAGAGAAGGTGGTQGAGRGEGCGGAGGGSDMPCSMGGGRVGKGSNMPRKPRSMGTTAVEQAGGGFHLGVAYGATFIGEGGGSGCGSGMPCMGSGQAPGSWVRCRDSYLDHRMGERSR